MPWLSFSTTMMRSVMAVVMTMAIMATKAEAFSTSCCVLNNKPSSWVLCSKSSLSDDDDDMYAELTRRIESLSAAEANQAAVFDDGLRRRIQDVAAADATESELFNKQRNAYLPVVALNTLLLPRQQFSGTTTDPNFSFFLRDLGLGGLFCLTSVNSKQRKVRRSGVLVKIESLDVARDNSEGIMPTAVRFVISGKSRCRVVGPARDMVARIGRLRRCYDPDGEEPSLGWGEEKFADSVFGGAILKAEEDNGGVAPASVALKAQYGEWPRTEVRCLTFEGDDDEALDDDLVVRARALLPLLNRWLSLVSDPTTYTNVDIVVAVSLRPGGGVDPSRLLKTVLKELGDRPPPTRPTDLAFWGAALITSPLLGESAPEIRGSILEAANANRCLDALERGLLRSIQNLEGRKPLLPYE